MFSSLNTAVSGLQQFQQQIDVIGNNMANVNTAGYKDASVNFEDALSQAVTGVDGQVGGGVLTASVASNFGQGTINSTGVASDMAISGQGFFVVKDTGSSADYITRDGTFHVDSTGYLVNDNGLRVQGYSDSALSTVGDLKIDATGAPSTAASGATVKSYSVGTDGKITVTLSDNTTFVRGQVLLQNVNDTSALVKCGDNLYSNYAAGGALSTPAAPGTNGLGSVEGNSLESSNVDLTTEMSNLILAQRAFEASSKIVTTSDQILQDTVNLKQG